MSISMRGISAAETAVARAKPTRIAVVRRRVSSAIQASSVSMWPASQSAGPWAPAPAARSGASASTEWKAVSVSSVSEAMPRLAKAPISSTAGTLVFISAIQPAIVVRPETSTGTRRCSRQWSAASAELAARRASSS